MAGRPGGGAGAVHAGRRHGAGALVAGCDSGAEFVCDYVAVLEFSGGKIARAKMYTDTRYMAAALMS